MTGLRSADLLRALGPGPSPPAARAAQGGDGPDFEALLSRAKAGTLETGLPVSVAAGAGVELSAPQLDRLSAVVDRAHAAGASRIVVMMDGMTLDVDVLSRRVLGRADLADGRVLTGVDGIVRLDGLTAELAQTLPPPGAGGLAPSLRRALESSGSAA